MFSVVGKHLVLEEGGEWRTEETRGGWPCPKKLSTPQLKFLVAPLLIRKLGKETPRTFVSPSTSDVTPTSICSLFALLVSIPCSNISQLHVLSISVQCPHVHNTLGWLDVLPIICSASS